MRGSWTFHTPGIHDPQPILGGPESSPDAVRRGRSAIHIVRISDLTSYVQDYESMEPHEPEKVELYIKAFRAGAVFPFVRGAYSGLDGAPQLWEGHHRTEAWRRLGFRTIPLLVPGPRHRGSR